MLPDEHRGQWFATLQKSSAESSHSWGIALALSVCLGLFGADRLYLGYPLLGLAKLFTVGGGGLWWIIDIILLLAGAMKDGEGKILKVRS